MQQPDGKLSPITDFFSKEQLEDMKCFKDQLLNLEQKATELKEETGKPHPVFSHGEILEIKEGKFQVDKIEKDYLILKPIKY